MNVYDYVDEFAKELKEQLKKDSERWGDTYLHRPRKGNASRIVDDIMDYFDRFKHGNQAFPYLKVSGNAYIGWLREKHPELSQEWEEPDTFNE